MDFIVSVSVGELCVISWAICWGEKTEEAGKNDFFILSEVPEW